MFWVKSELHQMDYLCTSAKDYRVSKCSLILYCCKIINSIMGSRVLEVSLKIWVYAQLL